MAGTERPQIVIPKLVRDVTASLAPAPIAIDIGSSVFQIGTRSAADWLLILMRGPDLWLEDIFPGMLDDPEGVEDLLVAGDLDVMDLVPLALEIIEQASGRPWWVTLRLIECIRTSWDTLGGEFVLRGIATTAISLAAWLDAALLILLRAMDEDKIQMFLLQLEAVPPDEEEPEVQGMDANQFLSMM